MKRFVKRPIDSSRDFQAFILTRVKRFEMSFENKSTRAILLINFQAVEKAKLVMIDAPSSLKYQKVLLLG